MPNLCTNRLHVSGTRIEIKRFYDAITQGELQDHEQFRILDNLLPTPKELHQVVKNGEDSPEKDANIAKYGHADWYEWNICNYGSKWSDYEGIVNDYSEKELNLVFMSAWSPIIQGIQNVSKQFPTTNFVLTYDEGGMQFCGGVAIKNGELLHSVEGEYPTIETDNWDWDDYERQSELLDEVMDIIHGTCESAF